MARKTSLTEKVADELRNELTSGAYSDCGIFTEAEISEKYGVSKTPAREALNILCSEGLLEKLPHKGYLLKKYSTVELENLLQFRYMLETFSVETAIREADNEQIACIHRYCDELAGRSEDEIRENYFELNKKFHVMVISLTGNNLLEQSLSNIIDQLKIALPPKIMTHTMVAEHYQLVYALEKRDTEEAKQIIRQYIENIRKRISTVIW